MFSYYINTFLNGVYSNINFKNSSTFPKYSLNQNIYTPDHLLLFSPYNKTNYLPTNNVFGSLHPDFYKIYNLKRF